jgi:hypothetical protein
MSTKPANEATWQCPKCKRWQSHERGICLSEYDTGIPCDGKQPHPAAPADAEDAEPALTCAQCDMPMSRNPHCAAGVPRTVHEIGAEWVCIPCTMRALNTCDTLKHQAYGELERIAKAIGYAGTYMKPGELRDAVIAALAAARRLLDAPPGAGERMREALEFYASPSMYQQLYDGGSKAREALAAPAPAEPEKRS